MEQALLALQICGQVTLFSRHSHRKTFFRRGCVNILSFQVIRCERTKRAPYERQQTEHEQTIRLQHGVRGVWNHRFGWTVHGRNWRWRYCSNALSTAVRLECAGIFHFKLSFSGWTLFIVCTSSVEWGGELAPGFCFASRFMKATVKSSVINLFHNCGFFNIFFLISFESEIVLYFAHATEVRKANYHS